MRLLWVTPIGRRSKVGRFSRLVTDAIVRLGHDVTVVGSEPSPAENQHTFLATTLASVSDCLATQELDVFDAIVVNWGNHYADFAGAMQLLGRPTLVSIVHDADMASFSNGARAYADKMFSDIQPSIIQDGSVLNVIASASCAGVAHVPCYAPHLDACDGPLAVIPFAWSLESPEMFGEPVYGDRLRLLTFGDINPDRGADRVIEAIAASEALKSRMSYRLAGEIRENERERLLCLAREGQVDLEILGPIGDLELQYELAASDILACLRQTGLEGASVEVIEAMLCGRPVLISHGGFCTEIPVDCAVHVPKSTKVADIKAALECLQANRDAALKIGRNARAYAETIFAPSRYATDLLDLIETARSVSSYARLQTKLAKNLGDLGLAGDDGSSNRIVRAMEQLVPVGRRAAAFSAASVLQ